ncbi:MAG: PP2C family protein-serine/threonine phosphatase [Oscillospiraceae bacterium]
MILKLLRKLIPQKEEPSVKNANEAAAENDSADKDKMRRNCPPKNKPQLYMNVSLATDTGRVRKNNEDNFYLDGKYRHVYGRDECENYTELAETAHTYGIFDGMGGEAFGETASALASVQLGQTARILKEADVSDLPYQMNLFTRNANNAICDMLDDRGNARGGSTFAAVCVKEGYIYPFYLGDSRIYIFDEDGLLQITEDQTLAERKIKAGVYTREESENSIDHHKLTCYLGVDRSDMGLDCQPCMPIPVKHGLKLLMCTDGLTDMCSREEISQIMSERRIDTARALADKALENGGRDNVTCIVLEFGDSFI